MFKLEDLRKSENIVEMFDELQDGPQQLQKIARSVVSGYIIDERSGESWRRSIDEAMDIAKQVMTKKNFPWEGSANIKYPLICEASINFAARTYPELIPNNNIVMTDIIGNDPEGQKAQRGKRVADCLSYQCIKSPDWKEHLDRLLAMLPVVGTVFTKTYYSELEKRNCVELCPPDQIILNHDTTSSLDCARRVTHIIKKSINDIISNIRLGLYTDIDIEFLRPLDVAADDEDYEIELLEQHCYLDLDGDGYKEPYVVTVHESSKKVLRIVNRIKPKSVIKNKNGDVVKMDAIQYFQDYHFIRSPDGGYYSMGFGQLLLPLNKAINSLINQLIDAGTVAVTQGGFLGKGLRLKGGEMRFKPFEWKVLDAASGTDLRQNVFPFPVREPSGTLLQLLTLLIDIGKELTASTDALTGSMSASNVASSTLNGLQNEGKKILKAINKRLYESMTKSFQKLYELNYYYLTDKEYQNILDIPDISVKQDFELESNDVRPVADPELSTIEQKMSKAGVLMSLRTADPRAVDAYILQTMQFDPQLIQALLPPPDPNAPPPPEAMKMMAEAKLAEAKASDLMLSGQIKMQNAPLEAAKVQKDMEWIDSQKQESGSRIWKTMKDAAHNDQKIQVVANKSEQQELLKQIQEQHKQLKDNVDAILKDKELNIKATGNVMKHAADMAKVEESKNKDDGSRSV